MPPAHPGGPLHARRDEWFAVDAARHKMMPAQAPLLDRLEELT